MATTKRVDVEVAGRTLSLSNLDKTLYPAAHFTKSEVIDYYNRIAPVMVPHLHGRPISFKRYPDGVEGHSFFEKNKPKHAPDWIPIVTLGVGERDGGTIANYVRIEEPATLVWAANMAALEIHPGLSTADAITEPDFVVFDLDPGAPADIVQCCEVGLWLQETLGDLGLESFAKSSGSKGLQVYVPLNTPCTFEQSREFSLGIAQLMEKWHPAEIVTTQEKSKRPGKVLIDWMQNASFKTTIGVYSLRARERPTVSTPVTWDEVAACWETKDAGLLRFEANQVLERVDELGDLFAPTLALKQALPGR